MYVEINVMQTFIVNNPHSRGNLYLNALELLPARKGSEVRAR